MSSSPMIVLSHTQAQTAYPTGDPKFAVQQAFPAAIESELSDPFLMLDHFGPTAATETAANEDDFPVKWHPHRGMDICTYLISGTGRHADSLGNRASFSAPGIQWMSVGSGVEHAEGGGSPVGEIFEGFQIWLNVPAKDKMNPPKYGSHDSTTLPLLYNTDSQPLVPSSSSTTTSTSAASTTGKFEVARVIAGDVQGKVGPFETVTPIEVIDFFLPSSENYVHHIGSIMNNCIIYVYRGEGEINKQKVKKGSVVHLDASNSARAIALSSSPSQGLHVLVFAGRRLNEPIAWRGPIVMNSNRELEQTFKELYSGKFPPVRANFNYKKWSAFPKEQQTKILEQQKRFEATMNAAKQEL